jgi:Fe-S-cluster containining protein
MYPEDAYEQCVFFQNNKCSIHAVKPFVCLNYLHDTSKKELQATHDSVAAAWVDHQSEVYEISPNANIPKTP